MSAVDSFKLDAGGTFTRQYVYKSNAGTIIDMTGFTARAQVRNNMNQGVLLIDSVPTIDVPTGVITVQWSAGQTSKLLDPNYVWGLEISNATTGEVIVLLTGVATVVQEVVR